MYKLNNKTKSSYHRWELSIDCKNIFVLNNWLEVFELYPPCTLAPSAKWPNFFFTGTLYTQHTQYTLLIYTQNKFLKSRIFPRSFLSPWSTRSSPIIEHYTISYHITWCSTGVTLLTNVIAIEFLLFLNFKKSPSNVDLELFAKRFKHRFNLVSAFLHGWICTNAYLV